MFYATIIRVWKCQSCSYPWKKYGHGFDLHFTRNNAEADPSLKTLRIRIRTIDYQEQELVDQAAAEEDTVRNQLQEEWKQ